jgi:hypothetical protein
MPPVNDHHAAANQLRPAMKPRRDVPALDGALAGATGLGGNGGAAGLGGTAATIVAGGLLGWSDMRRSEARAAVEVPLDDWTFTSG